MTIPLPVQRVARRATRALGQATHQLRLLPSFLVIGAQRCGTTSLYKTLTEHPSVRPAVLHKGVHYFDTAYDKGFAWYRGHFPLATGRDQQPVTGEASPYYMFHPLAAERIARDLPEARLVVLLRDPVERAYSAHAHESARGFETEPFARALELEPERLAGEEERLRADPAYRSLAHQHNAYLARGRYAEQLDRIAATVGPDRLHVIDSGDLFQTPGPVLHRLGEFLGLSPWNWDRLEHRNSRSRPPMPADQLRRLDDYFAPHDERLRAFLGRDPSWRR
ncbi:MAG TPA: sulfotransferase [Mycobacteriales bacterium]|nr:sulfotransferase [Mycobacteriales bacterium]